MSRRVVCGELSMDLCLIPLPTVNLSESDCEILRRWASAYGAAARQRTVRQETTMSKHGMLPDFVSYQRQSDAGERVTLNFRFDENWKMQTKTMNLAKVKMAVNLTIT